MWLSILLRSRFRPVNPTAQVDIPTASLPERSLDLQLVHGKYSNNMRSLFRAETPMALSLIPSLLLLEAV